MIGSVFAAADPAPAPGGLMSYIPLIAILALFYFMLFRPQQKREKQRQSMISELQKGDRVLLVSGFYARIIKPGETVFTVEIGKGVQVEIDRNAIAQKVEQPAAADAKSECSTSASTPIFFNTFFMFISTIKLLPNPEPQTAIIFIKTSPLIPINLYKNNFYNIFNTSPLSALSLPSSQP